MRTITVRATQGKKKGSFTSDATTFGQIKRELVDNGFSYSESLQVIVQSTQSALMTDDSVIPAGDQVLFLMPKETKSGWTPYGFSEDCDDEDIQELIERKKELTIELAQVQADIDSYMVKAKTSVCTEEEDDTDREFRAMQAKLGI